VRISILLDTGVPQTLRAEKPQAPSRDIESEIRSLIDCIESGYDSHVEWLTLKKLYKVLCMCKNTSRNQRLKGMIEPILSKYGYHVGRGTVGRGEE
jgi:hypothetical protein